MYPRHRTVLAAASLSVAAIAAAAIVGQRPPMQPPPTDLPKPLGLIPPPPSTPNGTGGGEPPEDDDETSAPERGVRGVREVRVVGNVVYFDDVIVYDAENGRGTARLAALLAAHRDDLPAVATLHHERDLVGEILTLHHERDLVGEILRAKTPAPYADRAGGWHWDVALPDRRPSVLDGPALRPRRRGKRRGLSSAARTRQRAARRGPWTRRARKGRR